MNKNDELEEIDLQIGITSKSAKLRRKCIKLAKAKLFSLRDLPKWKRQLKNIKSAKTRTSK